MQDGTLDTTALHEQNRASWNEAASAYAQEIQQDVTFLQSGGKNLCPPEFDFLQNLNQWCHRAIHLQCAGGRDTLSLWNLGAKEGVGVDISDNMIAVAEEKSRLLNAPATWYRADILQTPDHLNGTANLVYTGRGALCWLMDLNAWAQVVARLLKPGGVLYCYEGHPIMNVWDLHAATYEFDPSPLYRNYFTTEVIEEASWPESYIPAESLPTAQPAPKYERMWTLADILNACIKAGLRIEKLGEHPDAYWNQFPNMPDEIRRRLPNTFSLLARKYTAS